MNAITHTLTALLAAVTLAMLPPSIHAEPKPKHMDDAGEHGVSLFLGAVVIGIPQFVGSRGTHQTLLLPWVELEGERWFIDTSSPQAGLSVWKTKTIKLDLLVQPRYGFEPDGDPLLIGLDDRGMTVEAGIRAQWSKAGYTAQFGYYTGAGGDTEGQAVNFGLSYVFARGPWSFIPALEWRWEDRALVNHQYGINAAQARANRLVYAGKATVVGGPGLTAIYEKDAWFIFGNLAYQRAGDGIRHSPIVGRDDGFIVGMGVGWAL